MTDLFKENGTKNEEIINVKESWDVNFWCDELSLKAEELEEIVNEVGPSPHDVRMHIAKKHLVQWPASF